MKCRFCQSPLEEDCEFCSNCGKDVSTPKIVLCIGKKKNGTICGAELQKGKNFCKKCGAKVDQSVFEKEEVLCANCRHAIADDEDYCSDCGFPRNGITDTLPASTDENSAALSSITKSAPAPPSGLVLSQNISLDDDFYKNNQTTPQNYDVDVDKKSDLPDKEIDRKAKEKTQTECVKIENQPFVNEVDGTTSDVYTIIPGKIDKTSELESQSIFVNEKSAAEVKVEGTVEAINSSVIEKQEDENEQIGHEKSKEINLELNANGEETKENDTDEKPVQEAICRTDSSSPVSEKHEDENEQIGHKKSKEINQELHANGDEPKEIDTDEKPVQEAICRTDSNSSVSEKQDGNEQIGHEKSKEINQELRANGDEPKEIDTDEKPVQEAICRTDSSSSVSEKQDENEQIGHEKSKEINQEFHAKENYPYKKPVEKETLGPNKVNINQRDEKTKSKENKILSTPVNKALERNNKAKDKSQTSKMKQDTGGKGSSMTRNVSKGNQMECVRVYFHALWFLEFDLKKSEMIYVRFDVPALGGWTSNEHKCRVVRSNYSQLVKTGAYGSSQIQLSSGLKDDFVELLLEMDIPKATFLHKDKRIEYKYFMKKKKKEDVYEQYITGYSQNRAIALKDRMTNIDKRSFFGKIKDKFVTRKEDSDRHGEDFNFSLLYFQPELFLNLSIGNEPNVSVEDGMMDLEQLLHCLKKIYLTDRCCFNSSEDEYRKQVSDTLLMPLLKTLDNATGSDGHEGTAEARMRMLKAITVLSVVRHFNMNLIQSAQELLARGLLVRPNHEDKKCYDLECIDRFVPEQGKRKLLEFLKGFMENMAKTAQNAKGAYIFFCMPLYHFLTGKVRPFEPVPYDTSYDKPEWWGKESLAKAVDDYKKVSRYNWTMTSQELITSLHHLFEWDYFFPRTIMSMLNLEELEGVIKGGKIPLEVCAACLVYFVRSSRPKYTVDTMTAMEMKVVAALHAFEAGCKALVPMDESNSKDSRIMQIKLLHEISRDLLTEVLSTDVPDMFTSAAQAFLHVAAVYEKLQVKADGMMSETAACSDLMRTLDMMNESVQNRLQYFFKSWNVYLERNLQVWNSIVAPQTLPSVTVRDAWNSKIEENLFDILENESTSSAIIDVYCKKVDSFQPSVQSFLGRLALKMIEKAYDPKGYKFDPRANDRFSGLLSGMFLRNWKTLPERKTENDILNYTFNWRPFPLFVNMLIGDDRKQFLLSEECNSAIAQALSLIVEREHTMREGRITVGNLKEIIAAQDRYLELATIACKKPKEDVSKIITVRQRELDSYNIQKSHVKELKRICRHLEHVNLEELDSTLRLLEKNEDDYCINDIWEPAKMETVTQDNLSPQISAFHFSAEVISMLKPLHEWSNNNIFSKVWIEIGRTSNAKSLDEVCEQVWKPAYNKMKDIIQNLSSGDIKFDEMKKYLGNEYNGDFDKILHEITSLKLSENIAKERVGQLRQFHELGACVRGAKAILNIAENYGLNGDFKEIKIIASQENAAERKMKEFDDSVLQVCDSLRNLTQEKIVCLENFMKCKPLVMWVRESMKDGLKELKVFVDLAMISAGEGDMEIDKVNFLHAAITGYASLIFDLAEDSAYKELLYKCETLWEALNRDENLPTKLVDANHHLDQWKTVKWSHGSVEVTSLAQAETINSNGVYWIGALNTDKDTTSKVLNLHNVLHLTLPDSDKEVKGPRKYTFEQLQDLQSRLMLVAGKAEQGNDDIERFMLILDNVIRLANVFLKLTSAGCVLFKHWQTKFLCDSSRPVCAFIKFGQEAKPIKGRRPKEDETRKGRETKRKNDAEIIRRLAQFMENCLKKWEEHISQKRLEYFELNYFTSDQLVILQQELVKFGTDQSPDNRIYPLLSAIKGNCKSEDLVDAMRMASKDMKEEKKINGELKNVEDQENNEVKYDEKENIDEMKVQNFIKEMAEAGFPERVAKAALQHVAPDDINAGLYWCDDHEDDESLQGEDNVDMEIGDSAIEGSLYEGWKKSDKSVASLTTEIISKMKISQDDMDVEPLIKDLKDLWEAFLSSLSSSVSDYLSVEHLGLILRKLAEKEEIQIERPFPPSFVLGVPNLIVCPKAEVLSTVLSIYIMDLQQPLPQTDEVLMCTPQTTLDQLDVFLIRTVTDTSSKIHCLVNSDLLAFEVSDAGERRLERYMQQKQDNGDKCRLVVICSSENEYKSHIIAALDKFRRPAFPIIEIKHIAAHVQRKFKVMKENTAAVVDFDRSCVRVVKSHRAGVGKSLYVLRRSEALAEQNSLHKIMDFNTIHLQDKEINVSHVMQILLNHIKSPESTMPRIFHLDIAHEVQEGVDIFLFNLLILGCLTDKSGYVWRRSPQDLYLVETIPILEKIPAQKHDGIASYIDHVFDFLPHITCRSPKESLDILTKNLIPKDYKEEDQLFDIKECNGPIFQRSCQYLSKLDQQTIDNVDPNTPYGTPDDCLKVLLRHCGIQDPSWAELHHFVWFLNTQLLDFEKSVFCQDYMAVDLPGFSKFVLRFLVQMSRDFSTRSLQMSEESPTIDQDVVAENEDSNKDETQVLDQYQMKRTWESSPHPYLFFNPDGNTITFLGFYIDRSTGNLIDQQTGRVLEPSIMKRDLFDSLVRNRVPLREDFDLLERNEKIERLCRVMGNDLPHDPDDTYELTTDNVKKILAIYMRFRCDIPVIIMGETGCGKTRLVKFLCSLQSPPGTDVKNMILMKVHGGTTKADIKKKVLEAEENAQLNVKVYGANMYTVLFFDEANTTESIGMIKEILCDKSLEGKVLDKSQNLKFVAACNPYRKHSEDLIKRLENAGLGYHVDAEKTSDKLGRVPMRRLVYRVQPLPQSLLPLVWDFGQLKTHVENLYIRQMVRRYIQEKKLPKIPGLIKVVSRVLTASQDFMRKQEDECSFVSLRDVERVLSVMSWFYAQSQIQKGRTLFNRMDQMIQEEHQKIKERKEMEQEEEVTKEMADEENEYIKDDEGEDEMDEEPEIEDDEVEKEEEEVNAEEVEENKNEVKTKMGHVSDDITRSLILSLGVCYHACLKKRRKYRTHVAQFFKSPCRLVNGPVQIYQEITRCQDVFLENIDDLEERNIARNAALKENVFMMVICTELRIPLFLVGKPGSSKSLAKTIVADAMQGNAAHTNLFKELKQVCRNINRIKVCMETGSTVVLLNLENLYESLYDALNQYYVNFGGERYVDLGLGTHRVKCRVHKNFRLIVVAEKDVVYKKFPIPLINRLEKHFLTANTVLTEKNKSLAVELETWAKNFCEDKKAISNFSKTKTTWSVEEVFMGFHSDTCSSIVLHLSQRLEKQMLEKQIPDTSDSSSLILDEAKKLLLWCATPDAVIRLKNSLLPVKQQKLISDIYMKEQCHENLAQYLHFKLKIEKTEELFAQITTHSKLLSATVKLEIQQAVGIPPDNIALETLQSFDTEQQFSRQIRSFLESKPGEELLFVIQCDSGDTNANLVACARYCILDEHQKIKEEHKASCHVIFIIQLPRLAGDCFTGFQCGLWHSVHIDDLRSQDEEMPLISEMLGKSVGTLMEEAVKGANRPGELPVTMGTDDFETDRKALNAQRVVQVQAKEMELQSEKARINNFPQRVDKQLNVRSLIRSCVQPALALVRDEKETTERSTRRIELMLHLLHSEHKEGLPTFLNGLSCQIAVLLKEKEKRADRAEEWLSNEAAKPENINKAGTFRRACAQYLETKISPVLAGIIAHIDTNQNLDIVYHHISAGDWIAQLWLQILNTPGAIQLQYSDLLSPARKQELNEIAVKTTGCEGQMFAAEMPFSWLIYEQIDSIWRTAQDRQDESVQANMEIIIDLVKKTQLGQLLDTCEGHISTEEIVQLYAKDFTFMVYRTNTDVENEFVCSALLHTSAKLKNASPGIVAGLVWLHECHHRLIQHLLHFRSINQVWPECSKAIKSMQEEKPDRFPKASDQFTLTIPGLTLLIEELNPPDKLNDASNCHKWLEKISIYRPVIEKGLTLCSSSNVTGSDEAIRYAQQIWTRVTMVRLFVEHVVTYADREAEKYGVKKIMLLWVMLKVPPDFKQVKSLESVEDFLRRCTKTAETVLFGKMQICSSCKANLDGAPVILPCEDVICKKCFSELDPEVTKTCPECSSSIPEDFDPNAPEKKRKEVQKFQDYLSRCNSFFMDFVSQLCFAYNTAPSDQVVDKLLGYITMTTSPERKGKKEICLLTKELTIFEDCIDPNPVFRSFLLQLLLKTSEEKVKSNLEKYFMQAKDVMSTQNKDSELHMVQLCQLVVQCLEDSFYQNCAKGDELATAWMYLKDAEQNINPSMNDAENEETSPNLLNTIYGIAKARFGLAVTAKHIHETILKKGQMVTTEQGRLIIQAANLCMGSCKWPKIFFIKYLCRYFGVDSYQALWRKNTSTEDLSWIKYEKEEAEKVKVSDRYIVCGPHYMKIRDAVTKVVVGEDVDAEQLNKTIEETKIPENRLEILLCLAMHREITMIHLYGDDQTKVQSPHIEMLLKYCSEASFLKNKDIAQKILKNTCGVPFLTVTPDLDLKQQGVLCLLMHCDITLKNLHGNRTLVQPLVRLATQPHSMRNAYIPTMPLNELDNILELLKAQEDGTDTTTFYTCPNFHPYVIGECGRPWTESKCPACGKSIGGQWHVARDGNAQFSGSTETGHILGRADSRIQIGPKRKLDKTACAIVRLLTHLAMMLGANFDSQAVREFIKPVISDIMDIPQFLWQHVVSDLDDLHRILGKSIDDVFIIMHIILSYMMEEHDENEAKHGDEICGLTTTEAREKWETMFYEKYVAPVIKDTKFKLEEHNKQMVQNATPGTVQLLNLLYETEAHEVHDPLKMLQEIPAMWRYRSRITIDHMQHEFEITSTKKSVKQPKVLELFLKEEHHLRAIRYIPSILKLQRILFQKYQRRLDRAEASTMITVGDLRKQSKNEDELPKLLDDYAEAWNLVRESLPFVPVEYHGERINDSTPISWLLPTASDAGQCAEKLLKFLFSTQNYFLDKYYREVKRSIKEMPHVKVRDITPAHLISYHPEQDILPLVLANCNYSFEVGKGTTIEYNFANLERQIVDRFLFGKSWIDIKIELMVYRAEFTNATVFKKLHEKILQEPLSSGIKHQISEEFRDLSELCLALDNLDIAISFLKSIGGNPENNLDMFMEKTLKMKQTFISSKARQICQYRHAQSLWLLLSLEKNKRLALRRKVTFDGVKEEFKQQLSAEHQELVMTFLHPLPLEILGLLLELMFECIVLVISVPQDPNDEDFVDFTNNRLIDYLRPLMDEKDVDILDTFPEEVLCKFCVATWTLTCESLQERKGQN